MIDKIILWHKKYLNLFSTEEKQPAHENLA